MTHHARLFFATASLLMMFAGSCHIAMAAENVGNGRMDTATSFASETRLLSDTNESIGTHASVDFPDNPSDYFVRVQTAREMLRAGDCAGAVPLLERATKDYSDNGNVWGLLGKCQADVDEWEGAAEAYTEALKLGVQPWDLDLDLNPNDMMVEIAAVYAQAGNHKEAQVWLRRGLKARYDERPNIAKAPEFASFRDHEEFMNLAGVRPNRTLPRDEEWQCDVSGSRRIYRLVFLPTNILRDATPPLKLLRR